LIQTLNWGLHAEVYLFDPDPVFGRLFRLQKLGFARSVQNQASRQIAAAALTQASRIAASLLLGRRHVRGKHIAQQLPIAAGAPPHDDVLAMVERLARSIP
jgi:hypothetical protein